MKKGRLTIVPICVVAVPGIALAMKEFTWPTTKEIILPYISVGLVLGILHLIVRPMIRWISKPLGCLSFGLMGTLIDIGLIYAASAVVETFNQPSIAFVCLTALVVNVLAGLFVKGR